MSKRSLLLLVFTTALLLASASAAAQSQDLTRSPDMDAEMLEINLSLPGFGGMFFDENGRPTVYLADSSSAQRLKALNPKVVILQADYDFRTLQNYRVDLRSALSLDGVVALDVDERANRVRVSIDQDLHPKRKAQLRRKLLRMSPDPQAVIVDEAPQFMRHVSLRDSVRPIPGGVEIGFPGFLCTLGFNVNGSAAFVTNSHCTTIQGGVEFTAYTQDAGGGSIGIEIADPAYDVLPCPTARCRRSDAALVSYNSNALSSPGRIARTVTCNAGGANDFEIDGDLTIVAIATASVGQTVTKVGRTTGCRRGVVDQTCVDIPVSGTDITLLCQTIVRANFLPLSQGGDSGSPVFFQEGNTAIAVGLLWGGDGSGQLMVYSPILQVLDELF